MTRPVLGVALGLLLAPAAAHAHALDVATARVSLRDEHLEVQAEWDLFLLLELDPTALATASESALSDAHRRMVQRLESETRALVDGRPAALKLTGSPSPPELRALAATLSAAGQTHGTLVRLRLEAPERLSEARSIALVAPQALGQVAVTFVQPATRFVAPGQAAAFTVLRPPAAPAKPEPDGLGSVAMFGFLTLAAAASAKRFFS
jgi:hypothetical protein